MVLVIMYFHGTTIQDLARARGLGQTCLRALFWLGGLPVATAKQVDMQNECDFLSLTHAVRHCLRTAVLPAEE